MKRLLQIVVSLLLLVPTGCIFHRHPKTAPPQALAPSPLETTQADNSSPAPSTAPATTPAQTPPTVTTPPATQPATPPPASTTQEKPPHHVFHHKKPDEVASNAAPEVSAIGQLSPGDPSDLRLQTDSSLNSIDQTLKRLNRTLSDQEQKTVAQIREFLKQARAALATGDVDGAHTLALKAQVLLNEITH